MNLIKKLAQIALISLSLAGASIANAEMKPAEAPTAKPATVPATAPAKTDKPADPHHKEAKKAPATPIDVNKATEAELQKIPGVGPAKAKAIVEYRTKNGPFKTVADVKKVNGIGDKIIQHLKV